MRFAEEYLRQLETFAARAALPRVRALHLPPGRYATDNRGEFCALELEDGSLGLSFVLLGDTLERLIEAEDSLGLAGMDALALARRYAEADLVSRALGFAAANAITRCLYARAGFQPELNTDSIGQLQPRPGEHIGMIGKFSPLVRRILDCGAKLTIVELKPELAGEHDGYRVTLDASELASCTKIVSTSTLLLNDTLERMLASCRHAESFAMIGPSAGCLPDALFARGVTLIGGSWITDAGGYSAALRAGAPLSAYARKCALTPANYPGFEVLLARAAAGPGGPATAGARMV